MRSTVSGWPLLVLLAVTGPACGGDDDSTASTSASPPASLASVDLWCETYAEVLPAAASPNPDGRELEVLDLQIERAESLAAGAPGVPTDAVDAAHEVLTGIVGIRQRVADGEALPDVLQDVFADADSPFMAAAQVIDDEAATICP